jgi:hypothetical protein
VDADDRHREVHDHQERRPPGQRAGEHEDAADELGVDRDDGAHERDREPLLSQERLELEHPVPVEDVVVRHVDEEDAEKGPDGERRVRTGAVEGVQAGKGSHPATMTRRRGDAKPDRPGISAATGTP